MRHHKRLLETQENPSFLRRRAATSSLKTSGKPRQHNSHGGSVDHCGTANSTKHNATSNRRSSLRLDGLLVYGLLVRGLSRMGPRHFSCTLPVWRWRQTGEFLGAFCVFRTDIAQDGRKGRIVRQQILSATQPSAKHLSVWIHSSQACLPKPFLIALMKQALGVMVPQTR